MKNIHQLAAVAFVLSVVSLAYGQAGSACELNEASQDLLIDAPEGYELAAYSFSPLPPGNNSALGDGEGIIINLGERQGFRLYCPPAGVGYGVALIQCAIRVSSPNVAVAVAGLSVPSGGALADLDGGIATNQPANGQRFTDRWDVLELFFNPEGGAVAPVFQAVSVSSEEVTIYIDSIAVQPLHDLQPDDLVERLHLNGPTPTPTETPLPGPAPIAGRLTFRAYIDGEDYVLIQGRTLQYVHLMWALPGLHEGHNDPTTINGAEWMPVWTGSSSDEYVASAPLLPERDGYDYELIIETGRSVVELRQAPSETNGYMAVIYFGDMFGGAAWYEITLQWRESTPSDPTPTPTVRPTNTPEAPRPSDGLYVYDACRVFGLGTIEGAAYSPDGRLVATGGREGVYIWDVETGERLHDLHGRYDDHRFNLAFSPDGSLLAAAGSIEGGVDLWSTSTGERVRTLSGHRHSYVASTAFSADGTRLLEGGWDDTANLWDVNTGTILHTFVHGDLVNSVALSPDGAWALTGGHNGVAILWSTEMGELVRFYPKHGDMIDVVAFSPDGAKVLTAGGWVNEAGWQLWDFESGELLQSATGREAMTSDAVFSPDGRAIITAGMYDNQAHIWDAETGALVHTFSEYGDEVVSVAVSGAGVDLEADQVRVLVATRDYSTGRNAQIWTVSGDQAELHQSFGGHTPAVGGVSFSPVADRLATIHLDGSARIWDLEDGESPVLVIPAADSPARLQYTGIDYSPDGTRVVTASRESRSRDAEIRSAETGELLLTLNGHNHQVLAVRYSPDGSRIVTGSNDNRAMVWDAATGELVQTFVGHDNRVYSVDISPDGQRVLTGSGHDVARLWDMETGRILKRFNPDFTATFMPVAFSADGTLILAGGADTPGGRLQVWDAESLELLFELPPAADVDYYGTQAASVSRKELTEPRKTDHFSATVALTISQDNSRIAYTNGSIAYMWDAETQERLRVFAGHAAGLHDVEFSRDGELLATGSYDGTTRLWCLADLPPVVVSTPTPTRTPEPTRTFVPTPTRVPQATLWVEDWTHLWGGDIPNDRIHYGGTGAHSAAWSGSVSAAAYHDYLTQDTVLIFADSAGHTIGEPVPLVRWNCRVHLFWDGEHFLCIYVGGDGLMLKRFSPEGTLVSTRTLGEADYDRRYNTFAEFRDGVLHTGFQEGYSLKLMDFSADGEELDRKQISIGFEYRAMTWLDNGVAGLGAGRMRIVDFEEPLVRNDAPFQPILTVTPSGSIHWNGNTLIALAGAEGQEDTWIMFTQAFDSSGEPLGERNVISVLPADSVYGTVNFASELIWTGSQYLAVWERGGEGNWAMEDTFVRLLDANGVPITEEIRVNFRPLDQTNHATAFIGDAFALFAIEQGRFNPSVEYYRIESSLLEAAGG